MKAKLLPPLIDVLLDCFLLLIGPDDGPGIVVSTIPELAAALLRENSTCSLNTCGTGKIVVDDLPQTWNESADVVNVSDV